jgi:hypothetical protein
MFPENNSSKTLRFEGKHWDLGETLGFEGKDWDSRGNIRIRGETLGFEGNKTKYFPRKLT